ncbi:MAG: sulfurtransferase [Chloroflexi bacterium]|nr:sulfurtransferase [Chloroflexota bacterium]
MLNMTPLLVSVEDLQSLPENARVIDVRWKLGDPSAGRAMFDTGHIPGAVFVDMDTDLAEPPGRGGRHPLPEPDRFAAAMSRAGVDDSTWVIAYDDGGAGAPRLWWLLRHFGHANVSILNGGYQAWIDSGGAVESGPAALPNPTRFEAKPRGNDFVDVEEVRGALQAGSVHVLDARALERWRGDVEPVDRVAGRIPGSINAPSGANLENGAFRSAEELRDYYERLGVLDGAPIVVSCGSGVSACVDLVALERAGIHDAKLFPGSFSAWIAHDLPVERGP